MNWTRMFLALVLSVAWGGYQAARAVDSQRPLTQALLRIWQVPQGLPRATIFSLQQTRSGYLWLGTQAGLYRFDGVRFVRAPIEAIDQPAAWILGLCEDHEQNLWIATDGDGLIRWRDGQATHFGLADNLPSLQVHALAVDRRGVLWIGTERGLARLEPNQRGPDQRVEAIDCDLPEPAIRALSLADDTLWVGTSEGQVLTLHDLAAPQPTCQLVDSKLLPDNCTIHALQVDTDGAVWIGTNAGLIRRTSDEERLLTTTEGLGNNTIHRLQLARDGGIWLGTKDGLCRIQGERIENFQTRQGLSQSNVYALCEDHEGSLWVGTKHGLNQLVDRRTLLPFTINEGLPSNDTGPLLQDPAGRMWVGTLGMGLARFGTRNFSTVVTAANGLTGDTVRSLAAGSGDELWIGTDAGLCHMRGDKIIRQYTQRDGLPAERIQCLAFDADQTLWVGTSGGLVSLRDDQFLAPSLAPNAVDDSLARQSVQALVRDHQGNMIASLAGRGLARIRDGHLAPLEGPTAHWPDVDALWVAPDQRLWAALRGSGLGLIAGDQAYRFGVKDGLYDDDIFGLVGDDHGRLWMACSRGIFSILLSDVEELIAGRQKQLVSMPFSPTDALRTIECQDGVQPAIWKARDGKVWVSTIRGVIVIDPERSQRKLPPPSIVIEEVRVNGQDTRPPQLQDLPPGQANFDFRYTALSFVSPNRLAFRYKLEGFDRDWIPAGARREAFYTNLAPGSYRFRVRAVSPDGVEHEAAQPVAFTLRPLFYQTAWFYVLLLSGLVATGWLAYRLRVRQIKERMQAVLAERSRIARELHDTLIQGFSGVTMQMQALAKRLHRSPEQQTLTEIIQDAGGCLSEARRSVAGLRNSLGGESGLAEAIAQTARQLTESGDVHLRLQLAPLAARFPADVEYNVLRIVHEAITNAVKHSAASLIEVKLNSDQHRVTISVHDDGHGFDLEQHLQHVKPGHYGLVGMRERASQIGADIQWRSQLRQGTTVTLSRPV
jgi:signal transduction histidine kinase/ligand-binding sensor domain-containing protein